MISLKTVYQCFNGENESRRIEISAQEYKNTPILIEFRLPDGNTFVSNDLITDDNGEVIYPLPKEILYQNGRVSVQATIALSDGKIEKSSVASFPINGSINSHDDFSILLYNNRLYPKGGNKLRLVGDNDCYKVKFVGIENIGEVFAIFSRDNKTSKPILLNDDGSVNIPLWVLKKGNFELGLYAEGFASAPLEIIVDESIVEQSGVIVDESEPSIVEQLLNKVNSIKYIKSCQIINGKLIVILNDDSEIDAGYVVGGSTALTIQSDWNQNENLQPDYIRNRTHYKEIDEDGNVVYHTLDNKYLNLDKEISQGSDNPVTSKAVYKAVTEVEMESLSNLEIEELIKNFV